MISAVTGITPASISISAPESAEGAPTGSAQSRAAADPSDADLSASATGSDTSSSPAADSGLRREQRVNSSAAAAEAEQQEIAQQEAALITELSALDREVRTHEQAHQAAGGALAGAAQYSYEVGPDGRRYAVAGEVSIQAPVSSGDAAQDLTDAQTILRAALAPSDPSTQDLQVAAAARR